MSGNQGGVQKILQDSLKKQIPYVHCYNHKLHLVVIDLLKKVPELKQFFDKLCLLYTFFSKFKVGSVYQGARLKWVLDTRWLGHYHATCTVIENFNEIVGALSSVVSGPDSVNFDADTYAVAIGLLNKVKSKLFRFCCISMKKLLGILKPLDQSLQCRETDLEEAMDLVDTALKLVSATRTDSHFTTVCESVESLLPNTISPT